MKFVEGTDVKTLDGDKVGQIDHVIIDPQTNEVTHIVVEKGFLFKEDRVIPVEALSPGEDDQVVLTSTQDFEAFPLYEERYYVSTDGERVHGVHPDDYAMPLYYYPPIAAGGPYVQPIYPEQPVAVATGRNVPADTVALDKGTKVMAADGKQAGHIHEIITNNDDRVTHIVISKGFLFPEERVVPINWVRRMGEDEIQLLVNTQIVEELPPYQN